MPWFKVGGACREPLARRVKAARSWSWLVVVLLAMPMVGSAAEVTTEHVTARLIAERDPVAPGTSVELALVLDIQPGWHTYWRNPGDSGEAPRIAWSLPEGVIASPIRWPRPELIRVGPLANYGYSGRAMHLVSLSVPPDWPAGTPISIRADAHWLVCEEHCIPESGVLELKLQTAETAGGADPRWADLFATARAALPSERLQGALFGAHEGGLRLSIPLAGNPRLQVDDAASVWLFAGTWGLIEHAAAQPWRIRENRLQIDLTPGDLATSADPDGVLVVSGRDGSSTAFSVSAERGAWPATAVGAAEAERLTWPLTLAFALLGGLILNLMPCVFPVLAIKALSLAGGHGGGGRQRVLHGLAYTGGVLLFFGLLGGLLLALRAGGTAVGWGFQLQYPPFVALMANVFLVVGLALAGAVTLGGSWMAVGGRQTGGGVAGAFATGALAALVAAPCTAPFMGAALGYGLTLPWAQALLVILTLGLGLALPFLLVSLAPPLARRLPRPGPWMETLKQGLAFPMLAAAAWLVWVIAVQTGPDGVGRVLAGMLALALGLWVRERTRLGSSRMRRAGGVVALTGLGLALWLGLSTGGREAPAMRLGTSTENGRQALVADAYSASRLADARTEGRAVLVNMTAAWCITCMVNERVALSTAATAALLDEHRVLYLKGDWTNRDPAITAYLAGFGRTGVPLYVYYAPGREPHVLPQILTGGIVRDAVEGSSALAGEPSAM
ncbi:protein-disulfide reductase DsbD family protein [Thiocystis violacea]|uniref:protein-disulfide reductase DsbD family protein n=1 Tax=Thiocystis violacea TaxID=13725 RepID=UPI001904D61B|nr:thioredoxin family protein [Thiocystis violacea]MBK1722574.1 protein-disulfide reductase [Thiocystis violacea]